MRDSIRALLTLLYDAETADARLPRVNALLDKYTMAAPYPFKPLDQRTALLITYADQVRAENQAPLQTLGAFLDAHARTIISGVHVLPFYPSSSDDGFAVMDYYAVDRNFGMWADIARLNENFELMFDAVINHASAQGEWFQKFLRGEMPYANFFLTVTDEFDTTNVIRPRALPLLTAFQTAQGKKWVWTTFSADQADLNYKHPELLLQILDVLLFYVSRGARFLRLDAIAFLWKASGTTCLHLPQTHAVIQFFRAVLNEIEPRIILVTETNVPHADNISYFGDGTNEAQWVYNFALPPLTLHTLQTGSARKLARWAKTLRTPSSRTAFFNFLASHDGIGLNPARGILTPTEIDTLVARTRERGGLISYKNNPDGTTSPYEMNINYLDALTAPGEAEEISVARFQCAHSILLSLAGVPGIYFHSLFGSRGDRAGADASGIARRINRQKLTRTELERALRDGTSRRAQVFARLANLLRVRAKHAAFHPNASQIILEPDPRVFALVRSSENEHIVCLHNVTDAPVQFQINALGQAWRELLSDRSVNAERVNLSPYECAWLLKLA